MIIVNQKTFVNPHPVNRARMTQVTDDLLAGLIALRRERTIPAWKLRAAGIAPLGELAAEQRRRHEAVRSEVAA